MLNFLLLLIPRFVTDRVALYESEDGTLQVLCLEEEVEHYEEHLVVHCGSIRTFTWLNWCSGGSVLIDQKGD